jgi:hypothetical protein
MLNSCSYTAYLKQNIMSATVILAEIADIRPGYLTRKPVKPRPDGTYHLLQIRDFNPDRSAVDPTALIRFNPDSLSSAQPLQPGEVVFLARGAKNFACAVSNLPVATLAAGYFFVLRPHSKVLSSYLAWYLNQPSTLRALSRVATSGAHMPVVRRTDIENLEILLPPLPIQHTIAEIDTLMREEQSLLQELARKKQELISTACMAVVQSAGTIGEH